MKPNLWFGGKLPEKLVILVEFPKFLFAQSEVGLLCRSMEFGNLMFRYLEISWDFGVNCRSGNPARAIKRKNFSLKSLSFFSNKLKNDSNSHPPALLENGVMLWLMDDGVTML